MDIDEFLDREVKAPAEDADEKAGGTLKWHESKQAGISDEVWEYSKKDYHKEIKLALEKNDFGTAEKLYLELWAKLSDAAWNQKIYDDLIKIGDEIKGALNEVYSEVSKKKAFARNLLNKANENIADGNYQAALMQYSELADLHNEIPSLFFEEKRKMHNDILNLYAELKGKIDSVFLDKSNASLSQIRQMIDNARSSLKNMELDKAKSIYLSIVHTYTDFPAGFLSEKVDIAGDILELYKEISISLEIKALEGRLRIEKAQGTEKGQPFVKHTIPESGAAHRKEIEKLRKISMHKRKQPKKHGYSAIKSLGSAAKKGKNYAELKNLLVKRRLDRAKLKMDKGFYNEARKDFESVLRLDPGNEEARSMLNKAV